MKKKTGSEYSNDFENQLNALNSNQKLLDLPPPNEIKQMIMPTPQPPPLGQLLKEISPAKKPQVAPPS